MLAASFREEALGSCSLLGELRVSGFGFRV